MASGATMGIASRPASATAKRSLFRRPMIQARKHTRITAQPSRIRTRARGAYCPVPSKGTKNCSLITRIIRASHCRSENSRAPGCG